MEDRMAVRNFAAASTLTFAKTGYTFTPLPLDPEIKGTSGSDDLYGTSSSDVIRGFAGNDYLYGLAGDDTLDGGTGADVMAGGTGNDTYYIDSMQDVVWEWGGEGIDTAVMSVVGWFMPAQVENLVLAGANHYGVGNSLDNVITGSFEADTLDGQGGNDTLEGGLGNDRLYGKAGTDLLFGGAGQDYLNGEAGTDTLTGGANADEFYWWSTEQMGTTRALMDVITDFNAAEGDIINLSSVDANVYAAGDQAFRFIGQAAFTTGVPGEINYVHANGNTIIQLQTGESPDVEGGIILQGIHTPQASWFVL
jgi:Ca2+-binding RTX toxin-like protein